MSNEQVPFLDLVTPHRELEDELVAVFRQALRSAAFVGGEEVEAFEREFAAYCGATHSVGVANGTDAVRFGSARERYGPVGCGSIAHRYQPGTTGVPACATELVRGPPPHPR